MRDFLAFNCSTNVFICLKLVNKIWHQSDCTNAKVHKPAVKQVYSAFHQHSLPWKRKGKHKKFDFQTIMDKDYWVVKDRKQNFKGYTNALLTWVFRNRMERMLRHADVTLDPTFHSLSIYHKCLHNVSNKLL